MKNSLDFRGNSFQREVRCALKQRLSRCLVENHQLEAKFTIQRCFFDFLEPIIENSVMRELCLGMKGIFKLDKPSFNEIS